MGGKNYFCDYCNCFIKNNISIRKIHNSGISHTIAKSRYLRQFEDPQKVYEQEKLKSPCSRFFKGFCKFGTICHYTHYTEKQLQQLQNISKQIEKCKKKRLKNASKVQQEYAKGLPWNSYESQNNKTKLPKKLPESLRPIQFSKMNDHNINMEWG